MQGKNQKKVNFIHHFSKGFTKSYSIFEKVKKANLDLDSKKILKFLRKFGKNVL